MGRTKGSVNKKDVADDIVSGVEEMAEKGVKENTIIYGVDKNNLVPTGSTLFNLALSGHYHGGYNLGKFVNIIGDSHTGKTVLALTCLAECANTPRFDDYRLIYDDSENSNQFDIPKLFGKKAFKRIETDILSERFEDWQDNIEKCIRKEQPFIYVLDSFDSLTSTAEVERGDDNFKLREKGKDEKGSYGDKAKKASEFFRMKKGEINRLNSLVIIISQTRDNIGFGAMFTPKVRSGGKALKFFSTVEAWMSVKKTHKKGDYSIGNQVSIKVTKNKITGKKRTIEAQILDGVGVDNIKANIEFLISQKRWSVEGRSIVAKDFDTKATLDKLIAFIEGNNMEDELAKLVGDEWNKIEDSLKPNRKQKYD